MNLLKLASVAGAAVTSFLVLGAVTIELLTATVGGDIGPGIIGVFVGVVAGVGAAVAVGRRWRTSTVRSRSLLLAYAAFGLTLVFLAFLSYVNTPGVDEVLNLQRNVVIAVVVAALAGIGNWRLHPKARPGARDGPGGR